MTGDGAIGGGFDEVTVGGDTGVNTGVFVFGTSRSEGSNTILEPGTILVFNHQRSTRISLTGVLSLGPSTHHHLLSNVTGVFVFAGFVIDEWDIDLTKGL